MKDERERERKKKAKDSSLTIRCIVNLMLVKLINYILPNDTEQTNERG